jgi:hypothetical protein
VSDPGVLHYLRAVSELATAPDLIDRLVGDHGAGEDGHCAAGVCGRPGRGSPYLTWPCPTRRFADLAHAVRVSRLNSAKPRVSP